MDVHAGLPNDGGGRCLIIGYPGVIIFEIRISMLWFMEV